MRNRRVILTTMCMLYRDNGEFLVVNRLKQDWPGINFPGGHVEDEELISESVIREMKEETGLNVRSVENVGYYEWNSIEEGARHLAILFRSKDFSGEIRSSDEGEAFFLKEEDLEGKLLSQDFDKILKITRRGL